MNWLKRKWQKWRDARNAELRRRGYDYAAGQLLSHKGNQSTIERLESEASGTFDFNDFDQGIWDALFDWTRLHPEVTTQTLSKIRKLQDWADATALGRASTVEAFAAREGIDLAAVEAEIKADNQERNQAEQQMDAEWREAQDAVVTQALVEGAHRDLAKVLGPNGELWATAPDDTWIRRGESWPVPGTLVEACWSSRQKTPPTYNYERLVLEREYWEGEHNMSEWRNEEGSRMVFNPDFWRPVLKTKQEDEA